MSDNDNQGGHFSHQKTADLEARMAYFERSFEELSDVVAAQADKIDRLMRVVSGLLDRENNAQETSPLADQKPPHY